MRGNILHRTYLAIFRECPALSTLTLLTGIGNLPLALVNFFALPLYMSSYGIDERLIGVSVSSFLFLETIFKMPLGWLSDRYGRKLFIVFGPLLAALSPFLISFFHSWVIIALLWAWAGIGSASLWSPLFASVGDYTPSRHRAVAMNIISITYLAAIGVAWVLNESLKQLTESIKPSFYFASGFLFLGSVVAYIWFPKPQLLYTETDEASPAPTTTTPGTPPLPVVSRYSLPLIVSLSFLMTLSVSSIAYFLVLYINPSESHHVSSLGTILQLTNSEKMLLPFVIGLPVALFGVPLGHLADLMGKSLAVRISLVLSSALMWMIPLCTTFLLFSGVAVLLTIGYMFGIPAWLALVSGLAPTAGRGRVIGIVATVEGIAAICGPLVGSTLYKINPPYMFYGAAVFLSLGALLSLILLRARRGDRGE